MAIVMKTSDCAIKALEEAINSTDEESLIDNFFAEGFDNDWTFYAKQGKADPAVEAVVISKMQKGSEVHLKVKKMIDESLGVKKGQTGCTYPYLAKVVSNAIMSYYYADIGQNESIYE